MTLTEFLLARIAEDEEVARAAICQCGGPVCTPELGWFRRGEAEERLGTYSGAMHVLRFSPARVLAECEAKRRIVQRARPRYAVMYRESDRLLAEAGGQDSVGTVAASGPIWPYSQAEATLRDLALPYSDHPDYNHEEWAL